jgi:hypothetical protein
MREPGLAQRPDGPRGVGARLGGWATAIAVVIQGLWLWQIFPHAHLDADLLAYLSFFRDVRAGEAAAFAYIVPKALPILLFGPLGSPEAAFLVSLLVAALGGWLVFALTLERFGWVVAALASVAYVFDPMRSILTLRSSADLLVGVGLLLALFALRHRAVVWAGLALLLASLAKPLALACSLAILVRTDVPLGRRLIGMALPLLAIPAAIVVDALVDGRSVLASLLSLRLPTEHTEFVRVAQMPPGGPLAGLKSIFVEWFGGLLFARTWPLLGIGLLVFLAGSAGDARAAAGRIWPATSGRLSAAGRIWPATSGRLSASDVELLTVPLLLVACYLMLSAVQPVVLFTRFFWILSVTATILVAAGAMALAARAPVPVWGRVVLVGLFAIGILADRQAEFSWRRGLMLDPFETHAELAENSVAVLASDSRCAGPAALPQAYLPLAAWRAPEKHRRGEFCAIEDWAEGRGCTSARCVAAMPAAPTTARARILSERLLAQGWPRLVSSREGGLVHAGADLRNGSDEHGKPVADLSMDRSAGAPS